MKKLQQYLVKPEELKKKLQNPSFQHNFIQLNKCHLCGPSFSKRSKSPNESIHSHFERNNSQNKSKQNMKPNISFHSQSRLNNYSSKKNIKISLKDQSKSKTKNKSQQRGSHSRSQTQFQSHHKSIDDKTNCSIRTQDRQKCNSVHSIEKAGKSKMVVPKPKKNKQVNNKKQNQMEFNYSYRTRQGFHPNNPNKTNQDRYLIKTKFRNQQNHLFAVADGHGINGHHVSQNIVENMSSLLNKHTQTKKIQQALPPVFDDLQKSITECGFNVNCSGSTLVSVLLEPNHITCANVGDSRAILARQIDKKSWEMIYLSQDHKPSVQSQKKRILKQGGRIHTLKDQNGQSIGPLRVWLPNQNIQGLAMSRSLGDNVSKSIGVSHRPQIIKIGTDKRDSFILLASDGVWQFLTNQQVLQLIVPYYRQRRLEQACDALLKLAYEKWNVGDVCVVDDITFILIFLHP